MSLVDEFMSLAGISDESLAIFYLESSDYNIEEAMNNYFSNNNLDDQKHHEETVRAPDSAHSQVLLAHNHHSFNNSNNQASVFSMSGKVSNKNRRDKTLEEIFKPPFELMFDGTFMEAKKLAKQKQKWLLVNIQKGDVFHSNELNRDVWRSELVSDLIRNYFVFWQKLENVGEGIVILLFFLLNNSYYYIIKYFSFFSIAIYSFLQSKLFPIYCNY